MATRCRIEAAVHADGRRRRILEGSAALSAAVKQLLVVASSQPHRYMRATQGGRQSAWLRRHSFPCCSGDRMYLQANFEIFNREKKETGKKNQAAAVIVMREKGLLQFVTRQTVLPCRGYEGIKIHQRQLQ